MSTTINLSQAFMMAAKQISYAIANSAIQKTTANKANVSSFLKTIQIWAITTGVSKVEKALPSGGLIDNEVKTYIDNTLNALQSDLLSSCDVFNSNNFDLVMNYSKAVV